MSEKSDMTPQEETARTMRRWADAFKAVYESAATPAEHTADHWQARAESAEARVEELTTERASLKQDSAELDRRVRGLKSDRAVLRAEVERLTKQRDKAEFNEWEKIKLVEQLSKSLEDLEYDYHAADGAAEKAGLRVAHLEQEIAISENRAGGFAEERDEAEDELARLRTAVPRVIEPSEVRVGQKVVFSNHNNKTDWIVEDVDWETRFGSDYNGTIVLLSDDPEAEDDFPCCRKRGGE